MLDFMQLLNILQSQETKFYLHVSELAWERTENVTVVNMGDVFIVKYLELILN
jgi:polyribonucleotide nucleotidyltransferase